MRNPEINYKKTKNYFRFKLGFSQSDFTKVLNKWKEMHDKQLLDKNEVCDIIQGDWNAFMKWWQTVKKEFKICYGSIQ